MVNEKNEPINGRNVFTDMYKRLLEEKKINNLGSDLEEDIKAAVELGCGGTL